MWRPRRRDMMVATAWEVHGRLEALAEGGAQSLDRGLAGMAAVADQRRRLQARPASSLQRKRVEVVHPPLPRGALYKLPEGGFCCRKVSAVQSAWLPLGASQAG